MVVHPDSDRVSRARSYSGILYRIFSFRLRGSHPLWPPVPGSFAYEKMSDIEILQPPAEAGFRLFPFRSPLLRESLIDFYSSVT